MTRDEKTKFAHQAALHDRPEVDLTELKRAAENGEIPVVLSFRCVSGPDELILMIKSDRGLEYRRLNPEIVLNLAINLLQIGRKQAWFDATIEQTILKTDH